ncbi:MAG: recombination-associated protein RdgC [Nitrosomonas sp.]|nr:recombination-associated protein RdgC [Nitrosomonas sp.]MDP1950658.1 recombination-associated protein RdgC [Nitrosomonas sp.]
MWFKNLQIYRIGDWNITPVDLEEKLSKRALQECLRMEMQSSGWIPPREGGENFVHVLGQHMLIALGVEKKLLPANVINQQAKERTIEIEQQQGYKPGRKQIKDIKESVTLELLPRAFAQRRKTCAWIDPAGGWFVVDTPNVTKADELLEVLFKSVDNVVLKPVKTHLSPSSAMTSWLSGSDLPGSFTIDQHCELRGRSDEKATVSYNHHVLDSEEITRHVRAGKEATKLAMTWGSKISFILYENFQLKRITPLDIIKEPVETEEELFDSDFAIMTGELMQLLPDIIDILGGEENA